MDRGKFLNKLFPASLLFMFLAATVAESVITCGQVSGSLAPCFPYARGMVAAPSAACCAGIRSLNSADKTTADRQSTCKCLKTIARSFTDLNFGNVAGAAGKCGVRVSYNISPSTDCNSVK